MPRRAKNPRADRDGNPFELEADGLLAICIQHEMDHLVGKLFIDYFVAAEATTYSSESEKTDRLNARLKDKNQRVRIHYVLFFAGTPDFCSASFDRVVNFWT